MQGISTQDASLTLEGMVHAGHVVPLTPPLHLPLAPALTRWPSSLRLVGFSEGQVGGSQVQRGT